MRILLVEDDKNTCEAFEFCIHRNKKFHLAALRKVFGALTENGFVPQAVLRSSIQGGDGNTEFLMLSVLPEDRGTDSRMITDAELREVVYGKDA